MEASTLHEVEEALRAMDPNALREMAHQLAHSHVAVCGLTSREGDCSHIAEEEIRDRVAKLDPSQLVSLVAPTAWSAMHHHVHPPA
jgi:hypothetical protein